MQSAPSRRKTSDFIAEWGRTPSTNERFHSCIDVNFKDQMNHQVEAKIAPIMTKEIYGDSIINLNGSESIGDKLEYQWVIESHNPELYTLRDANKPFAQLILKNPEAAKTLTIALHVSNQEGSSNTEIKIIHHPAQSSEWIDLGKLTNAPQALETGDQLSIRTVKKNGKDSYYPAQPLIITDETKKEDIWPLTLGQLVNNSGSPLQIGVLDKGLHATPQPVQHATENTMYAKQNSNIQSAYLQIRKSSPTTPKCTITLMNGNSAWWAGLEIGTDLDQFKLDFSGTGIDLSKVTLDQGSFTAKIVGQMIYVTHKPGWVNINHPGYLGLNGNDNQALTNFQLPNCIE